MIGLTASGWGYVKIQVEADGDFLAVEKNAVTTREFDQATARSITRSFHNIFMSEETLVLCASVPCARNLFSL